MPENPKLFQTLSALQVCKLLQCVREGDKTQIEKLVLNGVPNLINVNEPTDGETALIIAAVENNVDMVTYLLDLGANPDVPDFKKRTPSMRAAECGNIECLQKLVESKANMKLTDVDGKGILFYCISPSTRHHKCLEIVLANEPDVNNVSKEGVPALVFACETAKANEDLCMMIINAGAQVNCRVERTNRTAVMAAAGSGSAKVVKALLERGAEVDALITKSMVHATHLAARCGAIDVLQVLSAYGAHFDQSDKQNNTPVHYGAMAGHGPCCRFLAQRGCNPKTKNNDKLLPRLLAKEHGHKLAMKEIRKGERQFGKTGKNNDPWRLTLYDSVCVKKDELTDMFTKSDSETPGKVTKEDFLDILRNARIAMPEDDLMKLVLDVYLVENLVTYKDFILGKKYVNKQYLISSFGGKKKRKKKGKRGKRRSKIPMPICTREDVERTEDGGPPNPLVQRHIRYTDASRFDRERPLAPVHLIEDDSAWYLHAPEKMYINLHDAAKHGDLNTIERALHAHKSVDCLDKYYKTPLMVACIHGNMTAVEFLLNNGANVNAKDNFKWTPLHFACQAGLKELVVLLLDSGAHLDAVALNGGTPVMRAIESCRPDVVQLLVERGAKVQNETRKGLSPLDLAVSWADLRVFDIVKARVDALPPIDPKKKNAARRSPSPKRANALPKLTA